MGTHAPGKSIVTVITKSVSDDSNEVVLNEQDSIWLRIIREGDVYGMHWSPDGQEFYMTRFSSFTKLEIKMNIWSGE